MKAIIFDFDGTLADSEPVHERALLAAAEIRGMTFTHEQFVELCVGRGAKAAYRNIAEVNGVELTEADRHEIEEDKRRRFRASIAAGEIELHPGAMQLVRATVDAGMLAAVCSGSSSVEVDPTLARLGLDGFVTAVVTSDRVTRHKPDPEPYIETLRRLSVDAADSVAIEDTPTGVASAKGAGMFTVAVEHSVPAEQLGEAHAVVPSIAALSLSLLSEMYRQHP